jgi:hypothetical protein
MFVASYLGSCVAQAAAYCACRAATGLSREMMARSARLAFSFLFFCGLVMAWVMRDFARPLIEKIPCERRCSGRGGPGGGAAAAARAAWSWGQ